MHLAKGIRARARAASLFSTAALLLAALPAPAATPASTLADLCPGTPDPCVVSGRFVVSGATVFDLEGRAFELAGGASLSGPMDSNISIVNASGINLRRGSVLAKTAAAAIAGPSAVPCPLERASHASAELAAFLGEVPTGTWTLQILDQFRGDSGLISQWGLEVCGASACSLFPSTDVPKSVADGSSVSSTVSVSSIEPITGLSIIDLRGVHTAVGDLEIHLVSPAGTDIVFLDNACGGTEDFDLDVVANSVGGFAPDVVLQATGACSLDGNLTVNAGTGGKGGTLRVVCNGVALGERSLISARGSTGRGGTLVLDAGAGAFRSGPAAAIEARGSGDLGGTLAVASGGPCTLERTTIRLSGVRNRVLGSSATGGFLAMSCEGIDLQASSIVADGAGPTPDSPSGNLGRGGKLKFDAGAGAFVSAPGTRLKAKARKRRGGGVRVTTSGPCAIGGTVDAAGRGPVVIGDAFGGPGGGSIDIACGDVTFPPSTKVVAGSVRPGLAGRIEILAAGAVEVEAGARLRSDGGAGGETIGIFADGACFVDGTLTATGVLGTAGDVNLRCAAVDLGPIGILESNSYGTTAGIVSVDTRGVLTGAPPGACVIAGKVRTIGASISYSGDGAAAGGEISMECGTTAAIEATAVVDASGIGADSQGGSIVVVSLSDSLVAGRLLARGGAFGGSAGVYSSGDAVVTGEIAAGGGRGFGATTVSACDLTVGAGAAIRAGGDSGANSLRAREILTVAGLVTTSPSGTNTLVYRASANVSGVVRPNATPAQDLGLTPCAS